MALVDELIQQGNKLFEAKTTLLDLWQSISEQFYPERADFTITRSLGVELCEGLATGAPVMFRRDLGNALGAMLRPSNKEWMHTRVEKWDEVSSEAKAWLERSEDRQRRAMQHRPSQFRKATSQADHDFVTFGQAVLQISVNSKADDLLYRCWHLRDCAWMENENGAIDTVYRKWIATALIISKLFPKTIHPELKAKLDKDPYFKVEIRHCVIPNDKQTPGKPYKSVYIDWLNRHIMEEVETAIFEYVIPRWQTVSGSQYAYSPAVVVALPDARTLQEMTITLLEAGEKAVNPPLLGIQEALRSDVNVMAGGITWVDREYDERLGEVLRPMTISKDGIPLGIELADRLQNQLKEAFYLDRLGLPPTGGPEMTAYEVGQRVQDHIRKTMPLFEPVENEYNAPLCETTFDILLKFGVFGSPFEIPQELRKREVEFMFESPLHDAAERAKAQRYLEAASLVANAMATDPSVAYILDHRKAVREALHVAGVPSNWMRSELDVDKMAEDDAEKQRTAELLAQMQAGAEVAATIGGTPAPSGTGNTGEMPMTV